MDLLDPLDPLERPAAPSPELRLTLAQLNPTVGDIEGNVRALVDAAHQAREQGAQVLVAPELALTGYHPGDLLDDPAFLDAVEAGLQRLRLASRQFGGLHWVVGLPQRRQGPGKPLHNALVVLREGEVVQTYAKQLLPTYDVFDERRHFEPGPDVAAVLRVGPWRLGLLLCEDGWNDAGQAYGTNPFERLRQARPDLVLAVNASPSHRGKRAQRHAVLGAASQRHGLPLLWVNPVGGQDQLVYDGASFAMEPRRGLVWEAARFAPEVRTLRFAGGQFLGLDGARPPRPDPRPEDPSAFYRAQIVLGLRDYARRCGFSRAVVGSSGGIDSALTLALAAEALGPQNVTAITLPSAISSAGSVEDSAALCRHLGVRLITHPIAALVQAHQDQCQASLGAPLQGVALENLQARVRGTVLMAWSNTHGDLVLTTGNKSELSVGYCTLYGDTNGGLGLLGDLYKTEVYALARHLNATAVGVPPIPAAILDKPPSAELAPGQRDTDSLPPYELLDEVLKWLIEGDRLDPAEAGRARATVDALQAHADGRALLARVRSLMTRSEYKRRQAPPVLRLRARAFGAGRQLPIAAVQAWPVLCETAG
ncbi:NAD+ synthase [Ideonella livida]|uniref:Glutamine-dependent NAD(+) synthetase n=1 Tax=Ideonella livida TaxID=2707176 RepID=A0A7C9TLE9_9BURK|nr:NAD+ synthase [Ideonella livida]NDY93480.1 NAD+ synthase [Ideonella livida]